LISNKDISFGVIEIGSNTTKSVIAFKKENEILFSEDLIITGRLSGNPNNDMSLSNNLISKNIEIVCDLYSKLKQSKVEKIFIIATEALRKSRDSKKFVSQIESMLELNVQILSPKEEAFYALNSIKTNNSKLCFDIGGASTELILKEINQEEFHSISIGAVTLNNLVKKDISEFDKLDDFLNLCYDFLSKYFNIINLTNLSSDTECYGIGGTYVSSYMIIKSIVSFNQSDIHLKSVTYKDFLVILNTLHKTPLKKRHKIIGLDFDRADILAFGIAINCYLMNKFKINQLFISTYGVRHGFIKHKLLGF
jgi:exopolyphosphatase/guanosine-5'-triphosphate,3'-diphosphate pyrophosphatase